MSFKNKPMMTAIALLATLDVLGIITIVAVPDLTPRLIPALVAVQILGFIGIALTSMRGVPSQENVSLSDASSSSVSGDWKFWLVGGFALLFLLRALLAVAYMAGRGWHGHQAFIPGAGFLISCYLLYLAYRLRKRSSLKTK
jgi:hypothetical protein